MACRSSGPPAGRCRAGPWRRSPRGWPSPRRRHRRWRRAPGRGPAGCGPGAAAPRTSRGRRQRRSAAASAAGNCPSAASASARSRAAAASRPGSRASRSSIGRASPGGGPAPAGGRWHAGGRRGRSARRRPGRRRSWRSRSAPQRGGEMVVHLGDEFEVGLFGVAFPDHRQATPAIWARSSFGRPFAGSSTATCTASQRRRLSAMARAWARGPPAPFRGWRGWRGRRPRPPSACRRGGGDRRRHPGQRGDSEAVWVSGSVAHAQRSFLEGCAGDRSAASAGLLPALPRPA